jgi:hypothetical protein
VSREATGLHLHMATYYCSETNPVIVAEAFSHDIHPNDQGRAAYMPERSEAIHKMPALSWSVIGEKRVLVYTSFESDEELLTCSVLI